MASTTTAPTTTGGTVAPPRGTASVAVVVLCIGSLCGALMQSLVIPIQGELPALLGTSASNSSWAVTATLLAGAVSMPVTGRLADMYGKKRVLLATSLVLAAGSLVAALSSTLAPFLAGRVLQGLAMGYIPVAISMVREIAPPHRAGGAVAAVSATLGVGGALGLPLAAWIAQDFSWHALFWLSTGLAVMVFGLTLAFVPHLHDARPGHIDVVGILGLAIGLSAALIGVSKGSSWGWGDATTWACTGGGVLVLLAWGAYEVRHRDPLVDLRTTVRRPVLFTNLAALLIGFGMMAQSIIVPQLLQLPEETGFGLGQTMLQAGLWMAPGGLMMLVFAPVSSRLMGTVGARTTLSLGAVVLGSGYLLALGMMGAPWQIMLASVVASAGVGIGYAAMPTLILDNVPAAESGSSVGVNALMRSVGTTIAGAVMAAVLTARTTEFVPGVAIPDERAFQICFLVGAGAALAGAAVALLIPRQRVRRSRSQRDG